MKLTVTQIEATLSVVCDYSRYEKNWRDGIRFAIN